MAWKRVAAKAAVVVLIATNVATVVWAGCWSYPYEQRPLSYCDRITGVEYLYIPDPPFVCGFHWNVFQGCADNVVERIRKVRQWSELDCVGVKLSEETQNAGTVHRDRSYVCGSS